MERRKRQGTVKSKRSKAGETLTETLVAMLIIGLSSVLFLTMVATSSRIFQSAEKRYEEIYGKITKADLQNQAPPYEIGTFIVDGIEDVEVSVNWYGDTDYVLSYSYKAG